MNYLIYTLACCMWTTIHTYMTTNINNYYTQEIKYFVEKYMLKIMTIHFYWHLLFWYPCLVLFLAIKKMWKDIETELKVEGGVGPNARKKLDVVGIF